MREFVWKVIDTDIPLKRDLTRGIINIRALAKYILKTQKLDSSLDAVISAIRRYQRSPENKERDSSAYSLLKQAKLSIRAKMASLELKRTDEVKTKLGRPDKIVSYLEHDTVRVFEGSNTVTLIVDRKNIEKMMNSFPKKCLLTVQRKVGMLEIHYPPALARTPGVFSIISGELAQHNISIINALISFDEHILVVEDQKLLKAFELIYSIINK